MPVDETARDTEASPAMLAQISTLMLPGSAERTSTSC